MDDKKIKLINLEEEACLIDDGHVIIDCCPRERIKTDKYTFKMFIPVARSYIYQNGHLDVTCGFCGSVYRLDNNFFKQIELKI